MRKQGYRDETRASPSSPAKAEVTAPRHKEGPAGLAKNDEKTKIRSGSRFERREGSFWSKFAQLFRG